MTVSDILRRNANTAQFSNDASRLLDARQKAAEKVAAGSKFTNRLDADRSGVTPALDRAKQDIVRVERLEFNRVLSQNILSEEEIVHKEVAAIFTEFESNANAVTLGILGKSSAQYADELLTKLEGILNKRGSDGYVFGGKNKNEKPVQQPLTTIDTLINDLPTSIFTEAGQDLTQIDISVDVEVRVHNLSASDEHIVKLIGALNLYKNQGNLDPSTNVIGIFEEAEQASRKKGFDISVGLQEVTSSQELNSQLKALATEKLKIQDVNVIEEQGIITTSQNTLVAMLALLQFENTFTNNLTSILRA